MISLFHFIRRGNGGNVNEIEKRKLKADIEYQDVDLDGNSEDYKYIYETVKWRMKEIIHKYDSPNKVQ